jgi:hypothetical protein
MKEHKFKTSFSSIIVKPLISLEKDKFLALASLEQVKKFIPQVDSETNYDLLPIAFNACVVNRINKNGDVINAATAIKLYKTFINKPIDVEHDREKVIGCILTAGFSEFGTDKPLSLEEVKDLKTPFNITLGGVIWRAINNGIANLIEDAADPTSKHYLTVSASWELGFTDYNLVVIQGESKNLEDAKIISDSAQVEELTPKLPAYGGTGRLEDGSYIYREMTNEVLAMGVGLTESPAAEVKGVAVQEDEDKSKAASIEDAILKVITEQKKPGGILCEEKIQNNANQISQPENDTVKDNSIISMKITSLKDITDEMLKQVKASSITDYIEEQLQEANKKFVAEKTAKEQAVENQKVLAADLEKAKEELKKIQASLEDLKKAAAERESQEVFTSRMASFDNTYDLTDEDRKVIASQIKSLTAEAFAEYEKQVAVLMKEKNKEVKKAAEAAKKATTEVKASTEDPNKVVDKALENAKVTTPPAPTTTQATQTLKEKYAAAFAPENFLIKK